MPSPNANSLLLEHRRQLSEQDRVVTNRRSVMCWAEWSVLHRNNSYAGNIPWGALCISPSQGRWAAQEKLLFPPTQHFQRSIRGSQPLQLWDRQAYHCGKNSAMLEPFITAFQRHKGVWAPWQKLGLGYQICINIWENEYKLYVPGLNHREHDRVNLRLGPDMGCHPTLTCKHTLSSFLQKNSLVSSYPRKLLEIVGCPFFKTRDWDRKCPLLPPQIRIGLLSPCTMFFVVSGWSVHCRMLNNVPDLYPRELRALLRPWQPKTLPNVPRGCRIALSWESLD